MLRVQLPRPGIPENKNLWFHMALSGILRSETRDSPRRQPVIHRYPLSQGVTEFAIPPEWKMVYILATGPVIVRATEREDFIIGPHTDKPDLQWGALLLGERPHGFTLTLDAEQDTILAIGRIEPYDALEQRGLADFAHYAHRKDMI